MLHGLWVGGGVNDEGTAGGEADAPDPAAGGVGFGRVGLQTLVEHFPHGLLALYDHDLRYTLMAGAGLKAVRMSPEDFVGRRLRDVFPPEVYERDEPALLAALAGETTTVVVPFGDRWFRVTTLPVRDPEGRVQAGMVVSEDVTELERTKAAHLEARTMLELATQAGRLAVWHVDLRTGRATWNDRMYEVYGVERGEPLPLEPWLGRVHPDDRPEALEHVRRARAGRSGAWALRVVGPEGAVRTIERSYSGRVDASGQPVFVAGVDVDVTERRAAEARSREAQKLEAMGRLTGGVAHDFNNVLHVIRSGVAEASGRLSPGHEALDCLRDIELAADRAARMVAQLLAFGRRQALSPIAVDLDALVGETVRMIRPLLGPRVQVELQTGSGARRIRADPAMVEQVVMNLALNARDAMPGGGRISLRTDHCVLTAERAQALGTAPGEHVRLAVEDEGTGMSPEVRARLFEPFFTTKGSAEGTGLGLATVYGVVAQHGGAIDLSSEVGVGTCFDVYWPIARVPGLAAEPARSSSVDPTPSADETVLVVDDDELVRRSVSASLRRAGYRVLEAPDGREGLALIEAGVERIDLALLDVQMPGLGGLQVWERLRGLRPDLPVVLSSGDVEGVVDGTAEVSPRPHFLRKPYDRGALLGTVRAALADPRRAE